MMNGPCENYDTSIRSCEYYDTCSIESYLCGIVGTHTATLAGPHQPGLRAVSRALSVLELCMWFRPLFYMYKLWCHPSKSEQQPLAASTALRSYAIRDLLFGVMSNLG